MIEWDFCDVVYWLIALLTFALQTQQLDAIKDFFYSIGLLLHLLLWFITNYPTNDWLPEITCYYYFTLYFVPSSVLLGFF